MSIDSKSIDKMRRDPQSRARGRRRPPVRDRAVPLSRGSGSSTIEGSTTGSFSSRTTSTTGCRLDTTASSGSSTRSSRRRTRSRTSTKTSARSRSVSSASTPAWRGRRIPRRARDTSCAMSGCARRRRPNEYDVQSAFLTYRNRGDTEVDVWAGRRDDLLRRIAPGTWQIARRKITIDQSTILSKNLSVFF